MEEIVFQDINLDFLRKLKIGFQYKKRNGVYFLEINERRPRVFIKSTIYFNDEKVMKEFRECLKNPALLFFSHPKVSIVTDLLKS